MYRFQIIGETPAKKNSRIINTKTGRSFPSKKYQDWHKGALSQMLAQKWSQIKEPISSPVNVTMYFTHADKRRRDSDNGASSIFDLLVDSGVLVDDNYTIVVSFSVYNSYEKNNANCIIEIEKL